MNISSDFALVLYTSLLLIVALNYWRHDTFLMARKCRALNCILCMPLFQSWRSGGEFDNSSGTGLDKLLIAKNLVFLPYLQSFVVVPCPCADGKQCLVLAACFTGNVCLQWTTEALVGNSLCSAVSTVATRDPASCPTSGWLGYLKAGSQKDRSS